MNIFLPFEKLLHTVFDISYSLTANYGLSLIVMSLIVTALTSPFYFFADKWKHQEQEIQVVMKSDLNSINTYFSKQKKFYLTQTCYRIYNYRLWYPLRTSFGLLIQIPFFFAAYNVLSNITDFSGKSFLFIIDLGKPDGVLPFGINFLPILMTFFNVVSAIFYSKSLRLKDNEQALVIATVFFLFLYDRAASLLLYWTCNNVLSLLKNIFVFFKDKKNVLIKEKITINLKNKFVRIVILVLILYISLLLYSKYSNVFAVLFLTFFCSINLAKILYYIIKTKKVFFDSTILEIISIFLFCLYNYYCMNNNSICDILFVSCSICNCLLVLIEPKKRDSLCLFSIKQSLVINTVFCALFAFILPYTFFFKNIADFSNTYLSVLIYLLKYSFIVFITVNLVNFVLFKKNSIIQICIIFFMCLYCFNGILLPLDAGFLSGTKFQNQGSVINPEKYLYIKDIIILLFCIYIVNYFITKKKNVIISLFIMVFLLSSVNMFVQFFKTVHVTRVVEKDIDSNLPNNYEVMHTFSRNKRNVVFFLADMMNGNYIGDCLEENPELFKVLSGFTWYEDTLSIGGSTVASVPAVFAGADFGPLEMNKTSNTYMQDAEVAIDRFFMPFLDNNFKVSYITQWRGMVFSETKVNEIRKNPDYEYYEQNPHEYLGYWAKNNNISIRKIRNSSLFLTVIMPVYKASPNIIKKYVYNYGIWNNVSTVLPEKQMEAAKDFALLHLLPIISSVKTTDKENFVFIFSNATHDPYGINNEGKLIKNYEDLTDKKLPYYSAKAFLLEIGKFVDWLKKNDIYDNTMIIICSDHGNPYCDNDLVRMFSELNVQQKYELGLAHAALLIKPFSSVNTDLIIDSISQMQNSDIYAIIQENVFNTGTFFSDVKKNSERTRTFSFYPNAPWKVEISRKFVEMSSYEVRGSMFDKKSWKKLASKVGS